MHRQIPLTPTLSPEGRGSRAENRAWRGGLAGALALTVALLAAALAPTARAAETIAVGLLSSGSSSAWPMLIGQKKGMFAAEGIELDVVYAQSSAAVIQQLTAGSTNATPDSGLVDPIRAIDKGAPLALVRLQIQAPPYALLAKPTITTLAGLKGRTIIIGGAKDITRIYVERMLAPAGLKPGDYDYVFAGATNARFSALNSGAVDAALLTAPFNFYAETAGFKNLGFTFDTAPDLPFSGITLNRTWAAAHPDLARRFLGVFSRAIAWFDDTANRAEAVAMMADYSHTKADDVARSYDFLRDKHLFEPSSVIPRAKLESILQALRDLGDIGDLTPEKLVLPGLAELSR